MPDPDEIKVIRVDTKPGGVRGSIADKQVAFGNGNQIIGSANLTFNNDPVSPTLSLGQNVDFIYDSVNHQLEIDEPILLDFWLLVSRHIQINRENANTVLSLPDPPGLGMMSVVADGQPGLNWGDTVLGGAGTKYIVWYNGTNWTVLGK